MAPIPGRRVSWWMPIAENNLMHVAVMQLINRYDPWLCKDDAQALVHLCFRWYVTRTISFPEGYVQESCCLWLRCGHRHCPPVLTIPHSSTITTGTTCHNNWPSHCHFFWTWRIFLCDRINRRYFHKKCWTERLNLSNRNYMEWEIEPIDMAFGLANAKKMRGQGEKIHPSWRQDKEGKRWNNVGSTYAT